MEGKEGQASATPCDDALEELPLVEHAHKDDHLIPDGIDNDIAAHMMRSAFMCCELRLQRYSVYEWVVSQQLDSRVEAIHESNCRLRRSALNGKVAKNRVVIRFELLNEDDAIAHASAASLIAGRLWASPGRS